VELDSVVHRHILQSRLFLKELKFELLDSLHHELRAQQRKQRRRDLA